jgi:RNA 2',3'-cyclic 3'-phosphodiesterase
MSEQTYRLFTAIPLPKAVRSLLSEWSEANKRQFPFQKWAHPDDLHITLFFMGDTDAGAIPKVCSALTEAVQAITPFTLHLSRIGTFGPPAAPSILWTGLEGDLDRLGTVHRNIQDKLVGLGWAKEDKPFRPHITLARRYNGMGPWTQLRSKLSMTGPAESTEWTCDRAVLYKSNLGRSPMYELMHEFEFSPG